MGCLRLAYHPSVDLQIVRSFSYVTSEKSISDAHNHNEARYYDSDVARFLSTDPWQAKYPGWSTYNYVMGNPISLIDPTGKGPEDIGVYTINSDGQITHKQTKKSDEKYDMLYTEENWNKKEYFTNNLRVDDQSILSNLSVNYGRDADGRTFLSSQGSLENITKVYKYVADNSDVEWSFSHGTINNKSTTIMGRYDCYPYQKAFSPPFEVYGFDSQNIKYAIHSHPEAALGTHTETTSMGYSNLNEPEGDWNNSISNFKKNNSYKSYVYFPGSHNLYWVSPYVTGPEHVTTVNSHKQLKR